MSAELPENLIPSTDRPEFWLGQIKTIADLERTGKLTKAEMVSEIHRVLESLQRNDGDKNRRARQFYERNQSEQSKSP